MAKYKFRLATLQWLREAQRNEHRAALAEAFRAEQVLAETQAEVAAETEAVRQLRRAASSQHYLDVSLVIEAQRYELLLKARGQELAKQSVLLAAETERRRQALVEADREVRALELLDERQRQDFIGEQHRQETKQLDEIATNRWIGTRSAE